MSSAQGLYNNSNNSDNTENGLMFKVMMIIAIRLPDNKVIILLATIITPRMTIILL
jgi:hypothetical protein